MDLLVIILRGCGCWRFWFSIIEETVLFPVFSLSLFSFILAGGEGSENDSVGGAAAASLKGGGVALEMVEAVEDEPFADS